MASAPPPPPLTVELLLQIGIVVSLHQHPVLVHLVVGQKSVGRRLVVLQQVGCGSVVAGGENPRRYLFGHFIAVRFVDVVNCGVAAQLQGEEDERGRMRLVILIRVWRKVLFPGKLINFGEFISSHNFGELSSKF